MNRPQSPCLGCRKRSEACHGTCGPYGWYRAEQEIYREFMRLQKAGERIDFPDLRLYPEKAGPPGVQHKQVRQV